jgi:hypothetical protein
MWGRPFRASLLARCHASCLTWPGPSQVSLASPYGSGQLFTIAAMSESSSDRMSLASMASCCPIIMRGPHAVPCSWHLEARQAAAGSAVHRC